MMLPLEGMRVLDLTQVVSGPYCSMILADAGADVVKLEPVSGGDMARSTEPTHNGQSYVFASLNRNKRAIALNLKDDEAREAALSLAESSDVVVENFRPGVAERLGIGYEAVRANNDKVIYCSISGFGQTGPYKHKPGFDIVVQGVSGLMLMNGHPDSRPAKLGIAFTDLAAGATAAQAIMAAYIHVLKGGDGQYVDVSLLESGLAWTAWESAAYFGTGELPAPTGTRHRRSAPYQAFRTADGYVTVGAQTEKFWKTFCENVVERPQWLDDPRFSTPLARIEHVDELEQEIEMVFRLRPTDYWVGLLDSHGIPGGPVYRYDEVLSDEHIQDRSFVVEMESPQLGSHKVLRSPIRFGTTPLNKFDPAPLHGQHTLELLREAGVNAANSESLIARGVAFQAQVQGAKGADSS